jgi:hypothetical protein
MCDGAWLDQFGACRTPADGTYPAACCAPYDCDQAHTLCDRIPPTCDVGQTPSVVNGCYGPCVDNALCAAGPQDLCVVTGGTWAVLACGNTFCGTPPPCGGTAPGCNCGRNRNFVDGQGCVEDRACLAKAGESCGGFSPDPVHCEPGLLCLQDQDAGIPDLPGTCQLNPDYVCGNSTACPTGASCCYPCGIPGCNMQCAFVDGNCPLLP